MLLAKAHRLREWLTLGDYSRDQDLATRSVLARYSRGNVAAQYGHSLSAKDLAELAIVGDRAIEAIDRERLRRARAQNVR